MFSKRKALRGNIHWDREFLASLGSDLSNAGFSKITVKIPINLQSILRDDQPLKQLVANELEAREITLQEFFDRERNYAAVILVTKNETTKETIKILFGNISKETHFADSTFPSGHSVRSTLYVQSPDPARVYPLFDFFYEFLTRKGHSTISTTIFGLFSLILLAVEIITLLGGGKGFAQSMWGTSILIDLLVILLAIYLMYAFFKTPTGLSVNDRRTATLSSYLQRAIKGDLRDNPIVNIILSVIASIITAVILRLLGWP